MGTRLSKELATFERIDYPPASKSRAFLSILANNSSTKRKWLSFGYHDSLSLDTDSRVISFLDNKKVPSESIERTSTEITSVIAPFNVTPSMFREIMTTGRMKTVTKELIQTMMAGIRFGSRSPSSDLDVMIKKMIPESKLEKAPTSTVQCGDKKCCVVDNSFDICNCDDDVVEISASNKSDSWYRIPSCISRYKDLESIFTPANNQIKAVENIEGMKRLKNIDLNDSRIDTVGGINDLPSIERLFLRTASLDTIDGIEDLPSLRSVDISHNGYLHDITPVKDLKNLKHLFVDWEHLNGGSINVVKEMIKTGVHVNLT